MTTAEQRERWMNCQAMTEELMGQLQSMNAETADDCFYRDLTFGTGGLRGVLGAGTNRMNVFTVMKATRGLGRYLLETFPEPSCAVSYDSRIHSLDFAQLTAAVLADMGIRVYLYRQLEPTPMLSYAVRSLNTSAGVMITASHNPARFNGYKVYGPDGCQITLEAANKIQSLIQAEPDLADNLPDFPAALRSGLVEYIPEETIESYYRDVMALSVVPASFPLHVVYTPLNGAGNVPVREIMRRLGNIRVDIVEEQEQPDGHFPTCPYPNPEIREAMELAIRKTIDVGADLCFATDPDSDRMGAGVRVGNDVTLITGNEMGVLMLDYLCRHKKPGSLPFVAVKTIVTTEMAAAICRKYGVELRNVLTGFKFIGEQIGLLEKAGQADRFLFGFEESYGYLSGTIVRDKDAVNAALLLCEMASHLKEEGKTLLDRLRELREEFGYYAQRLLTFEYEGERGAEQMAAIMAFFRKPQEEFKDPRLSNAERLDYHAGVGDLPRSDVIEFRLSDKEKFIVRPSGTEPKLKAYLFSTADSQPQAEKNLDTLESFVTALCRPS